jgi:hypothetical protein
MTVTFTLTSGSSGTAAGPFNISGTTSSNTTTELATGITKDQLTTGHTITGINDAITGGTIASTGTCTNTIPWNVVQATPTPTPTNAPTESYSYQLGPSYTQPNINMACNNVNMDPLTEVFAAAQYGSVVNQFFNDVNLTSQYQGESEFHAFYRTGDGGVGAYTGRVSSTGLVSSITLCT